MQFTAASIRHCWHRSAGSSRAAWGFCTPHCDARARPDCIKLLVQLTLMALVPARGGPVAGAGAGSQYAWLLMAAPITAAARLSPVNLELAQHRADRRHHIQQVSRVATLAAVHHMHAAGSKL